MGCHTWFHSDSEKLDLSYSLPPDEDDDKLWDEIQTKYHDCFRTASKELRYNEFILRSREETFAFIEKYRDQLSIYDNTFELVNKFWDEYPNGAIDFG